MTVGITELPPEGMQLGGVALAGDAERGTKTTDGLSLLFTTAGITVQGPQPQIERLLVWSGLDSASCREKIVLPDGRNAAVMELTSGGQSIRFLLPLDTVTPGQAAYLDQALPAWLSRYKGAATSASPPPTPTAAPTTAAAAAGAAATTMGTAATGGATAAGGASAGGASAGGASAGGATAAGAAAAGATAAGGATAAARSAGAPTSAGSNGSGRPAEAAPAPPPPPPPSPPSPPAPPAPPAGPPAPAPSAPVAGSTLPAPSGSLPPSAAPAASPAASAASAPPPPPGSLPPSAAPAASPAVSAASAPPPPPGSAGWVIASDPLPPGVAWDSPPPESLSATAPEAPAKKTRGWRKDKTAPPSATDAGVAAGLAAAATVPPPGAVSPMPPPSQPPVDPVPLAIDPPLPPPPAEPTVAPGPVVWKPPIDPATGAALWDETSPSTANPPPTKTRGWRKKGKVGAAGVAATAAVGTAATTSAAGVTSVDAPVTAGVGAAAVDPPAPPGVAPVQTGSAKPARKSSRATLAVLLVVLLVVIGGVAYFAVKRNNNSTSPPAGAPNPSPTAAPSPSPTVADSALAASINLRLTDLPAGWARTTTDQTARPPVAPVAAQARASQALAACVGQPLVVVSGLFGLAGVPGQTAAVRSPSFQEAADPGIQMVSQSTVMQTTGDAQSLTAPFLNPNFATCYGQFQSSLVSSAVPGSTAQVQTVQLPAPAGVKAFGYLTTYAIPNLGSEVVGQAFMIGGRVETLLEPSTNGPAVPSLPFGTAYHAVLGRLARSVNN